MDGLYGCGTPFTEFHKRTSSSSVSVFFFVLFDDGALASTPFASSCRDTRSLSEKNVNLAPNLFFPALAAGKDSYHRLPKPFA